MLDILHNPPPSYNLNGRENLSPSPQKKERRRKIAD